MCFEALNTVLQYEPGKPVYRLLHQLTTQLTQVDAIAHFHVARYQINDSPGNRIRPLFDSVIEPETNKDRRPNEAP